jgi:hypothetical protein
MEGLDGLPSQPRLASNGQTSTEPSAAQLARFARGVLATLWEGYDLDCCDIQDMAEEHGLIKCVPYDPDKHTDVLGVGPSPGDDWYVEVPGLAALAAQP